MSTIPKEIEEKIDKESECRYPVKTHQSPDNSPYVVSQITFKHGIYFGYQLATDGREELEKDNARLAECLVQLNKEKNRFKSQCTDLRNGLKKLKLFLPYNQQLEAEKILNKH
jgi:hypothetical protein